MCCKCSINLKFVKVLNETLIYKFSSNKFTKHFISKLFIQNYFSCTKSYYSNMCKTYKKYVDQMYVIEG